MAATQTIKWTAVPNGVDSGNLRLSVLISPELAGGPTGTLADFPDWQDWPGTLAGLDGVEWLVQFNRADGSSTQTLAVPLDTSGLNSALWKALFTSSVVYGPPEPIQDKFRALAVASYPVQHVTGFLQNQFTQYKNDEVPTLETLKSVYGPISDVLVGRTAQERFKKLAADRRANSKGGKVPHANNFAAATPAESFAAQAFYHLPAPGPPPQPEIPAIDFHRALTFIGQHGVLQRALGLVFDLLIPVKNVRLIIAQPGSNIFVSASLVNPQGLPPFSPGYVSVTPRTHCDASTSVFEPHSNSGQINARQLTVNDTTSFLPHVIDFDGAGLRASTFAAQIHLAENPGTINAHLVSSVVPLDPATPVAPPAMRSNGLTLTQVNRGLSFAQQLERAFLLFDAANNNSNNNGVPDLAAEDLVRGYVLDVLDTDDNTWRSTAEWLCTYTAGGQTVSGPTSPPFSESATQAPPRVQDSPLDDGTSQANVSEVLLRYNGWSNAVPRPGDPTPLNAPNEPISTDGPFSQLTIDVKPPPGRLPRLRFGHTYAMRARVIDVCNNAIAVDAGANVGDSQGRVTDPMVYGRHEPIGSPDVYSQSIPRLGESIKRLVIRDVDGPSALSKRALAPKRTAEPFAEWHSKFDTGAGGTLNGSSSTYNQIVGRESQQYPDPPADPTQAPPAISLTGHVPYLPDPLARGGVLTVLPGAGAAGSLANQQFTFDFCPPPPADNWPNYEPFGLQLKPGTAPPSSPTQQATKDAANRLITFQLSKADTVTLNLSSIFATSDFQNFGLGQFLVNPNAAAAAAGNYWAITPAEQIELIYAVQKPLLTPEFSNLGPARGIGDTVAGVLGDLTYSPKSTSTIDLIASWGDPVDDPVNKLPLQGPGTPNPNLRQTSNAPVTTLPSTTSGLPSADTQEFTATDRFAARHEFFDTKHRNVTYSAVATSQFSEFYPPGTDANVGTARPVTVNIPSSARPDTPKIAYVVPIYGWGLSTPHAGTTVSARTPSALRVFIERPWWSSGIDELLGVVTWPGAEPFFFIPFSKRNGKKARLSPFSSGVNAPVPHNEAQYVSDWGADPLFQSTPLPSLHPRVSSFPHAVHNGFGLSIEEDSSFTVNVAGHPVQFDATRNLWYCDIAIATGSTYTPMIKLALARYQPNSLAGVELSRIKLADIMSVEPGRTATVVRKNSHQLSSVTLTGISYSKAAGSRTAAPGQAELIVEKRKAAIHDDTLGWEQFGDPIRMTAGHARGGGTSWTARNVKVPSSGQVRLAINQYEVLPTDNRKPTRGFYSLTHRSQELRLLYQDLVPL